MMKPSRVFRFTPVVALALAAGACDQGWTDLTSVNENPNQPAEVPAPLVFTEGIQEAVDELLGNGLNMDYGEHLAQHTAEIAYSEEDIYQYRNTEIDGRFREAYAEYLMDFQEVILQGRAKQLPNVEAGGLIMQSWVMHNLTDIWGDLPYSEAFQGNAETPNITPAYDTQEEIYTALLANLTTAVGLIDTGSDPFGSQDLIYQGDMAAWQKFANSLRLRLAMRLADVAPEVAEAEFQAALDAPGGVFTSNDDNAQVCYGSVTRNPWFAYFEGRANDYRVSKTLVDTLTSLSDPRLPVYAAPIAADTMTDRYIGMPNGMLDGHGVKAGETSKPGAAFLAEDACLTLMSYAEVLFLQAEAAERWGIGGAADALYYDAITASMEQYGIADAAITAYLGQPEVQYDAGNWKASIGLQKWIALFGQGLEAFAEVRRLDYPQLKPGPGAVLDELPGRYPYPFGEETLNKASLQAALANQGMSSPNDHEVPVWWDVF
ncbi:MAG TPA: SusD/RagB family nutrient-binding outer membrane lipoprotein [Longimicrobiales bacterium]